MCDSVLLDIARSVLDAVCEYVDCIECDISVAQTKAHIHLIAEYSAYIEKAVLLLHACEYGRERRNLNHSPHLRSLSVPTSLMSTLMQRVEVVLGQGDVMYAHYVL